MEQLSAFFTNVQRIADAAERSAAALETIAMLQGGDDMPEIGTAPAQSAPGGAQSAPATDGGTKRKRRTKAEMAADAAQATANAGQAASVIGAVLGAPAAAPAAAPAMPGFPAFGAAPAAATPMAAPGFPAAAPVAAPGLPTAPAGAVPTPMAGAMDPSAAFVAAGQQPSTAAIAPQVTAPPVAQPPVAQPPVAQPPVAQPAAALPDVSQLAAQYAALPVEQQFGALLDLFAKYGNYIAVRDAMTQATGEVHCPMPLSDPLDRSKPGAAYTALANEARWHIYAALYRAASSVASAG